MIRQRKLSRRGFAHAVAESKVHAEDVAQAGQRRQVQWIPVEVPVEDGHVHCPKLGRGWQFILRQEDEGRGIVPADEEEFVAHLTAEADARGHYYAPMSDKKSGPRMVRRKKGNPVEQLAVCLPPWSSELLREMAADGQADGVRSFLNRAAYRLVDEFEGHTHRRVLGIAIHCDSQAIHFHLQFTRVGTPADGPVRAGALDVAYGGQAPLEKNYLLGTRALGTIGAATCSGLHMMLVGAVLPASTEYRQIQHSAFEFQRRRGIIPIDWLLWKLADELFRAAFGASPRLGQLAAAYRRASVQRRVAALEQVKARVTAEVAALAAQSRAGELVGQPDHAAPLAQLLAPPRPTQPTLPALG